MPRFKQPRRILLEILHDKRLTVSLLRKVGVLRQQGNLTIGPFAPKSENIALWRIVSNRSTHPASRFKYLQELIAAPTVVRNDLPPFSVPIIM